MSQLYCNIWNIQTGPLLIEIIALIKSFHEIGVYDASATIDAILEITQVQNIIYIGFSLGSTQAFVLLSEKPEYRHKISLMVLLAPAAIVSHGTSPIRLFSSLDLSLKGRVSYT